MFRIRSLRVAQVLVMLALGCARAPESSTTQAVVEMINRLRDQEIAAFNAGEADNLASCFTSDCSLMPPDGPMVSGQEALRSWSQGVAAQFVINGRYTGSDVTAAGDWAIERYTGILTLTPKAGGAPVEETVKGIHIYRRQADGSWRIAQDIWNSDAP